MKKSVGYYFKLVKRIRVRRREKENQIPRQTENKDMIDSINEVQKKKGSLVRSDSANIILFDHELTDFEFKLKYINLRDIKGREYGKRFPPYKTPFVIVDDEGRKFSATKAGVNQISGNILSFYKKNNIKPGDIISFEFDRNEMSNDGRHVLHLSLKN